MPYKFIIAFLLSFSVRSELFFKVAHAKDGAFLDLPKEDKPIDKPIGEDSFATTPISLVVADGVGGCEFSSAFLSSFLTREITRYMLSKNNENQRNPQTAYDYETIFGDLKAKISQKVKAYKNLIENKFDFSSPRTSNTDQDLTNKQRYAVSTTLVLANILHDKNTETSYLSLLQKGDSLAVVFRKQQSEKSNSWTEDVFHYVPVFMTNQQQQGFNFPDQFSTIMPDYEQSKNDALLFEIRADDIVILGSDGLFDNISINFLTFCLNLLILSQTNRQAMFSDSEGILDLAMKAYLEILGQNQSAIIKSLLLDHQVFKSKNSNFDSSNQTSDISQNQSVRMIKPKSNIQARDANITPLKNRPASAIQKQTYQLQGAENNFIDTSSEGQRANANPKPVIKNKAMESLYGRGEKLNLNGNTFSTKEYLQEPEDIDLNLSTENASSPNRFGSKSIGTIIPPQIYTATSNNLSNDSTNISNGFLGSERSRFSNIKAGLLNSDQKLNAMNRSSIIAPQNNLQYLTALNTIFNQQKKSRNSDQDNGSGSVEYNQASPQPTNNSLNQAFKGNNINQRLQEEQIVQRNFRQPTEQVLQNEKNLKDLSNTLDYVTANLQSLYKRKSQKQKLAENNQNILNGLNMNDLYQAVPVNPSNRIHPPQFTLNSANSNPFVKKEAQKNQQAAVDFRPPTQNRVNIQKFELPLQIDESFHYKKLLRPQPNSNTLNQQRILAGNNKDIKQSQQIVDFFKSLQFFKIPALSMLKEPSDALEEDHILDQEVELSLKKDFRFCSLQLERLNREFASDKFSLLIARLIKKLATVDQFYPSPFYMQAIQTTGAVRKIPPSGKDDDITVVATLVTTKKPKKETMDQLVKSLEIEELDWNRRSLSAVRFFKAYLYNNQAKTTENMGDQKQSHIII